MKGIITGAQCRMARGNLGISETELGRLSGLSIVTIRRIESVDGLPQCRVSSIQAVHDAFIKTGRVEFSDTGVIPVQANS
mgnify:CR=1 FL=1